MPTLPSPAQSAASRHRHPPRPVLRPVRPPARPGPRGVRPAPRRRHHRLGPARRLRAALGHGAGHRLLAPGPPARPGAGGPHRRRGRTPAHRGHPQAPHDLRPLRCPDRQGHRQGAAGPAQPCATAPTTGSTHRKNARPNPSRPPRRRVAERAARTSEPDLARPPRPTARTHRPPRTPEPEPTALPQPPVNRHQRRRLAALARQAGRRAA